MDFAVAVSVVGTRALVLDWGLVGPQGDIRALGRSSGELAVGRAFHCHGCIIAGGGVFGMALWFLHHVHSVRHRLLGGSGNRNVAFRSLSKAVSGPVLRSPVSAVGSNGRCNTI